MKNKTLSKILIVIIGFFVITCNSYPPDFKEKSFLKLMESLSTCQELYNYKDIYLSSKNNITKLIISDLKSFPILKKLHEGENFIVVPNNEISKISLKYYLLPKKVIITRDSCYVKFEIINSCNMKIEGSYSIVPDKPTENYDLRYVKSRLQFNSQKLK